MEKVYNHPLDFFAVFFLIVISLFIPGCRTKNDTQDAQNIREIKSAEFMKHVDLSDSSITYYDKDSEIFTSQASFGKESDEPFRVVDYYPAGDLPAEVRKPTIYVLFSQPVVPLAKLGEVMTSSNIMFITPAVTGIFRWYGSRLLSFEPSEKYLPQREYKVTILKNLKSLGGKHLIGDNEFRFHTEYLDIDYFYPGTTEKIYSLDDIPMEEAKNITISFTYPVDLNIIGQYLAVTSNNIPYTFSVSRPIDKEDLEENYVSRTVVLSIKKEFEENSLVTVTLLKGARSSADYIGRPDDVKKTFHTITPFTYKKYSSYSYSFPRSDRGDANPVYLEFSHQVDKKSVLDNITVSIPVDNIRDHIEVWGKYIKLANLPVNYGGSYEITMNKDIRDIYGRKLDENVTVKIDVKDASAYYYFPDYGTRFLESAFEPKIIFEHQNIFDGVWRIDTVKDPYDTFPASTLNAYDFSYVKKNEKHYKILSLSPWLNEDKKGFIGISWNFQKKNKKGVRPTWGQHNLQVEVTDIGITTRYGYNKIIVFAASLSTGKSIEGARVQIKTESSISLYEYTDKDGIAIFPFRQGEYLKYFTTNTQVSQPRIVVEKGRDKAVFIPNFSHNHYRFNIYNTTTINHSEDTKMKTHIFTDRGLYKPGETLTFGGIDRNITLGQFSVYSGPYKIEVRENYWDAESFHTVNGNTNTYGTFTGSLQLPESLEPGSYTIRYIREDKHQDVHFQVAHFRRLAFGVTLHKPDIVHYTGDNISIQCKAAYLAGGAMGNANYSYYWTKSLVHFTPPGNQWQEYRFGPNKYEGAIHVSSGSGKLSGNGQAEITQMTSIDTKGGTCVYECEVRVTDIDRQVVTGKKPVLVHPALFYIGTKIDSGTKGYWSYFVPREKKMDIAYTLVTPEGDVYKPGKNQILKVKLYHVDWKMALQRGVYGRMNRRYERVEELEDEQEISHPASSGKVSFTPQKCGSYFFECESVDSKGRDALTRLYFYSTGSSWINWGFDNPQDIKLIADKQIYKPGEKVKLLIQTPLQEGKYLLTIEREGIINEKIISLKGSANVIDIPVKENYLPVFYVAICSYSPRTEKPPASYFEPDLGKPQGYFGITEIRVSCDLKRIDLRIEPEKKTYAPGEQAHVTIKASYNGKPLQDAEITFLAADRGVLDLINYHVPDPLSHFYSPANFPLGTSGADSRSLLMDPVTYEIKDLPGGGGKGAMEQSLDEEEGNGEKDKVLDIRSDFRALAVFRHGLITDSGGTAYCDFTLPDTLTTYRMTAVAVKDAIFGKQENELMAQKLLNVRTALTRRLRVRDTSFAGVVITNLDNKIHKVTVTAESDILKIDGEQKKSASVPPGSSVEIPFTLLAVLTGEAEIRFTINSDILNERLEEKIIIEKPVIRETFTITGKTNSPTDANESREANEGIVIPSYIAEGYGGLTLVLDSTSLANLGDSVQYLFNYPYGCVEQNLSRLLPLILFGDKIEAFGLSGRVKNIGETIEQTLEKIGRFQNDDGGVPFWLEGGYDSSDYCSVKLAHVLYLAEENGYTAGPINKTRLLKYISQINRNNHSRYTEIYALYVRSLLGENISSRAVSLYKEDKQNDLTSYGFLGLIFYNNRNKERAQDCLTKIKNYMKVGTRTIDIIETAAGGYYFDSDVQKLALLLMLYNKLDPKSDFIDKITSTLMKHQKYGYWINTSDTGWALQAFSEILSGESGGKTGFIAKVTIGEKELLETAFKGVSRESYTRNFPFDEKPLSEFERDTLLPFTFTKQGIGNLFYTASLVYALPLEVIRARDEGFSIYSEIRDPGDTLLQADKLVLGQMYRMKVVVSSSKRRNFVVLRVPVPSGGEILDALFVTTATYSEEGGIDESSVISENAYGDEYELPYFPGYYKPRKKIMDNEVQYFFDDFRRGRQEVEFLFRLTTPGIYPTPPIYVECMYEAEVFGRTDGEIYVISE